jgi:outer membrane protein, heavy metal efflux system
MKRTIATLIGCLSLISTGANGTSPATPTELQSLVAQALARHPGLRAARLQAEAMEHRIGPAGSLPDPMIRLDLSNVPTSDWDFASTPMSGRQLGVSQQLPWPGLRAARERRARATAAAATARASDREAQIIHAVKRAWYELGFLDRAIDITGKNDQLLADFVRIAQTKYAVGRGLQQDVLKAQVAQSGLRDRLIVLRLQRRQAEVRLNAALDRDLETTVGRTADVMSTPRHRDVDELENLALQQRPALAALGYEVEGWQAAEAAARLQGRPDFEVSAAYRQRDFSTDPVRGSDFISAAVAVRLPIWRQRNEQEQETEARLNVRAITAEQEALALQIRLQIRERYLDVKAHDERMRWLRTAIIPQAKQSLNGALAGYQVDKVDFLTLLDSQVSLLEFEIDVYRHLTEAEKLMAQIEMTVGVQLTGAEEMQR